MKIWELGRNCETVDLFPLFMVAQNGVFLKGRKQPPVQPSPVDSRGRKGAEAPGLSSRLRKGLRPRGDLAVVSSAAP